MNESKLIEILLVEDNPRDAELMIRAFKESAYKTADAIMAAIEQVCREGKALPLDIGGAARTTEVTDAVISALS